MNDYLFFFVAGSSGSFVKTIFYYYLYKLKQYNNPVIFKINPVTGDYHSNTLPAHCHYFDQIDHNKKIIIVDFDENDKSAIIKMVFHKHFKFEIYKNPGLLIQNWDGKLAHIDPVNQDLLEEAFTQNPDYLIFPNWKKQVKNLSPVLTIKFKDVLYGELNEIIANFLKTAPLPEVDYYISEYRIINKKYVDKMPS